MADEQHSTEQSPGPGICQGGEGSNSNPLTETWILPWTVDEM